MSGRPDHRLDSVISASTRLGREPVVGLALLGSCNTTSLGVEVTVGQRLTLAPPLIVSW